MVIKTIIKFALIIGICMAVGSYLVYLNTGRFWVPQLPSNLTMPAFLKREYKPSMEPVSEPTEPTYKWMKNGQWYYGQKPPKGVNAVRLDKGEAEK